MSPSPVRLSALDSTFLELEDLDPCAHMHIGAVLVLEPRPDGSVPSVDEVRAHLDDRLHLLPRYRLRLAGPGTGTVSRQRWVPDAHFDVVRHVVPATLPEGSGWDELLAWAGEYFSVRLDRAMPLWQVAVVTGLAEGHWAIVTKTHHCLVDGVGAVDAGHLLLDDVPDAVLADGGREGEGAGGGRADGVLGPLRGAARLGRHPLGTAQRLAALGELVAREEVVGAPDLSINRPIGPRRRLRGVTFELDHARDVRRALGGTVNDVVLAGVCAGLRALLHARGEDLPACGVRAMVPMDVRRPGEALGNHISSLFVDLPVAEPDPARRHAQICEATARVKGGSLPLGAETLLAAGELAPPVVHRVVARALSSRRLFNLTVTNVPGPPVPLTALGAPLRSVWPLVPIAADHTLAVAVLSYAGRLTFGVCADRAGAPDVDTLTAGIVAGLDELCRVAAGRSPAQERPLPA